MSSRVFVVNDSGRLDFSDAERFGVLMTLTRKVNVYEPNSIRRELERGLESFDEETDYLCVGGNLVANAIALMCLKDGLRKKVQLLIYDALESRYMDRTITL